MGCFWRHDWQPRGVEHMNRVGYVRDDHGLLVKCPITEVLLVCRDCGVAKTICLDGHWTLDELTGENADREFLKQMRVRT
jgi:hypothetical protein